MRYCSACWRWLGTAARCGLQFNYRIADAVEGLHMLNVPPADNARRQARYLPRLCRAGQRHRLDSIS